MDNQKPNDGNARNQGLSGAGTSMGKDNDTNRDGGNMGGMPKDLAKDVSKDISKNASDIHKTIDKAADAAQPVVDRLATSAHAGVDKVSDALTGVTQRMDDKSRQLTDAYRNFADTGREYVRSSPATAVLVALGVGYTLSKLLGRRH